MSDWAAGLVTVLPILAGAAYGAYFPPPRRLLAAILALGAGSLVASIGDELFGPAREDLGTLPASAMLIAGSGAFVLITTLLDRRHRTERGGAKRGVGLALLVGVLLDGIPENAALGVAVSVDTGLLIAIAVANLPEAVAGAANQREDENASPGRVLRMWTLVSVVLFLVVPLADAGASTLGTGGIAAVQAFAGGAVLAVLADSIIPEAYRDGGRWVALATAVGFAGAYMLG